MPPKRYRGTDRAIFRRITPETPMRKTFGSLAAALLLVIGARTRAVVRRFQARIGRVPDGFAAAGLLDQLRALR
jgi:hypothetical protein